MQVGCWKSCSFSDPKGEVYHSRCDVFEEFMKAGIWGLRLKGWREASYRSIYSSLASMGTTSAHVGTKQTSVSY